MDDTPPEKRSGSRYNWADLQLRLMSAAVLVPIAAVAIFFGGWAIAIGMSLILAGAYWEFETMLTGRRQDWRGGVLLCLLAASPLGYAYAGFQGGLLSVGVSVLAGIVLVDPDKRYRLRVPAVGFLGMAALSVLALRGDSTAGIWAAAFLAVTIWLTDTGAFFTGRIVGGARLSPDISPGKTWAGAIGGLIIGALGGLVVWIMATASPIWTGIAIAALVSVLAQLGDLAESAMKRWFMVKDSGDIIPGHGGVLDRVDSFSAGGLALFVIGALHGGVDAVATGVLTW